MKFLDRNCRDITALVVAGEDRHLSWLERWVVRAHLKVCVACPLFNEQMRLMNRSFGRWRAYRDESEAA